MEFLVEFNVTVPPRDAHPDEVRRAGRRRGGGSGPPRPERAARTSVEADPRQPGETHAVGLYRERSEEELDGLLGGLPLNSWMKMTVTPLEQHPNDPGGATAFGPRSARSR